MRNAKLRLTIVTILSFLALCTAVLKLVGSGLSKRYTSLEVGTPLVWMDERYTVNSGVTQILAHQEQLFIVYGYESVVEVYTLDGDYQFTVGVFNHPNGRTEIAANQGMLYICDKIHNLYLFSGKDYVQFVDRADAKNLRSQLRFGKNSSEYNVRFGSVWYCSDEKEPFCVIKKPVLSALYQNNCLDLILLILIVMIGVILRFPHILKIKE